MTVLTGPACPWTVWNDGDAEPLHEAPTCQQAKHLLLGRPDHDYSYIQSPTGEQYAWNCFRKCWERI